MTPDGIEEDAFGEWARAASVIPAGTLREIIGAEGGSYLMATLARGAKYRARATAQNLSYQSHPMRRAFSLTFDLIREDADDDTVLDLTKAVRGIHESLVIAAGTEGVLPTRTTSACDAICTPS